MDLRKVLDYLPQIYKALVAAIPAAAAAYAAGIQNAPWYIAAVSAFAAAVVAGYGVWKVENKPAPASPQPPVDDTRDSGIMGRDEPF